MRPGADSTPVDDVDAAGTQVGDRLGHVVGAQASRDDEAMVVGHPFGQPPVEDLPRAGVGSVDEEEVGAEVLEAPDGRITGRERLDHRPDAGAHPLRLLGGLVAVQLRRTQAGDADDLDDPLRSLVTEHADRQHVLGQAFGDVAGQLHRRPVGATGRR